MCDFAEVRQGRKHDRLCRPGGKDTSLIAWSVDKSLDTSVMAEAQDKVRVSMPKRSAMLRSSERASKLPTAGGDRALWYMKWTASRNCLASEMNGSAEVNVSLLLPLAISEVS